MTRAELYGGSRAIVIRARYLNSMLRLILLRHAKAAREAGGGDRERRLTERGRRDAALMGAHIHDSGLVPDLAVASDSQRTRETMELAASALPQRVRILIEPSLYLASEYVLLASLRQTPPRIRTLLFCGHNPGMADFAIGLSGSGEPAAINLMSEKFPTAALAVLTFGGPDPDTRTWSSVTWRAGRLESFVTPATLASGVEDLD